MRTHLSFSCASRMAASAAARSAISMALRCASSFWSSAISSLAYIAQTKNSIINIWYEAQGPG